MNEFYYVVREERPHIDAPQIIRVRYLRKDGSLEAHFEAASKFPGELEAHRAAKLHMDRIAGDPEPAPLGTEVKVVACNFLTCGTLIVGVDGEINAHGRFNILPSTDAEN